MARIGSVGLDTAVAGVEPRTAMEKLARLGFACKGIVYILIGALAFMAALHEGGETTDHHGVIHRVAGQPFGEFALIVIAIGLIGYALWRILCAVTDCEGEGTDLKGLGKRVGYLASGLVYSGVSLYAIRLLTGNGGGSGDQARSWTARVLDLPGGPLLVITFGILVIGSGIYQIHRGLSEGFRRKLRFDNLGAAAQRWAIRAGKWGYTARGVIFVIIGFAFASAGLDTNPSEAKGTEAALDAIARKSYGDLLLALTALGLACYGIFSIIEARYRRVRT
jgi:hypothetical protein